jgi:hypothetical protein
VQTPSIRGKASLSFTLEMDEESLVDLERAVSYASEYMPTTTPRLELLLVTVKKMVKTLIHASPILLDIGQDVLQRSEPLQLLDSSASSGVGVRVVENSI